MANEDSKQDMAAKLLAAQQKKVAAAAMKQTEAAKVEGVADKKDWDANFDPSKVPPPGTAQAAAGTETPPKDDSVDGALAGPDGKPITADREKLDRQAEVDQEELFKQSATFLAMQKELDDLRARQALEEQTKARIEQGQGSVKELRREPSLADMNAMNRRIEEENDLNLPARSKLLKDMRAHEAGLKKNFQTADKGPDGKGKKA